MVKNFAGQGTSPGPNADKVPLSHSRIQLYKDCPFKFKLLSIDKWRPDPVKHFALGTVVHEIIENALKTMTLDEEDLDNRFDNLVAQWGRELDLRKATRKSIARLFEAAKLNGLTFDPECVEFRFGFDEFFNPTHFFGKTVKFRGVIDLWFRMEKDGKTTLVVLDHKTSKKKKSNAELQDDPQLKTYLLGLVKKGITADRYVSMINWVRHDCTSQVSFTIEQIADMEKTILEDMDFVWSEVAAEKFDRKYSWRCNWCECRTHCYVDDGSKK